MKNALVYAALIMLFLIAAVSGVHASEYGTYQPPAQSKSILINKLVATPQDNKGNGDSGEFVDNLSPTDPRFAPDQHVFFKLIVKNTSDIELTDVEVTDYVPEFLVPVTHPGDYDSDSHQITFNAGDFAVDEEKAYILEMKFVGTGDLSDNTITCVVNESKAEADDVSDNDSSQVCVEKPGVSGSTTSESTIVTIPSTGPELMGLVVAAEMATLGAGIYLNRKARK